MKYKNEIDLILFKLLSTLDRDAKTSLSLVDCYHLFDFLKSIKDDNDYPGIISINPSLDSIGTGYVSPNIVISFSFDYANYINIRLKANDSYIKRNYILKNNINVIRANLDRIDYENVIPGTRPLATQDDVVILVSNSSIVGYVIPETDIKYILKRFQSYPEFHYMIESIINNNI